MTPGGADQPGMAEQRPADSSYDAVLTGVTETMSSVLNRPVASPIEAFYRIGGNSLLLMVLLAKVRSRYRCQILPAEFLADPTAAGLARLISSRTTEAGGRG